MTPIGSQIVRILVAGLLAGAIIWGSLVILGMLVAFVQTVPDVPPTQIAAAFGGYLVVGLIGLIFALPIGLIAATLCAPVTLLVIRFIERRRLANAFAFILGGTISAIATAVSVWVIVLLFAIGNGSYDNQDSVLNGLLALAIGGPVAGYIYWRLARADLQGGVAGRKIEAP